MKQIIRDGAVEFATDEYVALDDSKFDIKFTTFLTRLQKRCKDYSEGWFFGPVSSTKNRRIETCASTRSVPTAPTCPSMSTSWSVWATCYLGIMVPFRGKAAEQAVLLTDGQAQSGYTLSRITSIVEGMRVPVYCIAYNYACKDARGSPFMDPEVSAMNTAAVRRPPLLFCFHKDWAVRYCWPDMALAGL